MNKNLLILAPLSVLALAACNKTETAAEGDAGTTAASAEPIAMPPAITATGTYRCADNTILYVDFLGANEAADIRIGDKAATAIRVTAPAVVAPAAGAAPATETTPAGPMTATDGESSLSGSGAQINVKLAGKGSQTCKK